MSYLLHLEKKYSLANRILVEVLSKQIQEMQGGTQDKKDTTGGVYKLYLATGEKVSLDISTVDGIGRLAVLEKELGNEGVGDTGDRRANHGPGHAGQQEEQADHCQGPGHAGQKEEQCQ